MSLFQCHISFQKMDRLGGAWEANLETPRKLPWVKHRVPSATDLSLWFWKTGKCAAQKASREVDVNAPLLSLALREK